MKPDPILQLAKSDGVIKTLENRVEALLIDLAASLEREDALKQQRDAAANSALDHASKYSNIVQAITDPENQPSQYGTVTLAMYNKLKQQRDELQHQLSGMTDSAKHFSNGMEYYRGLIDEAAKSIGIAMYTADDQGVHPDPLRAKLPECVAELVQQRDEYKKDAERYRWLRSYLSTKDFPILTGRGRRDAPDETDYIDAAIDAAIAKVKP